MSKTLIYGGYAPSISVSEFSGFSQQIFDESLPTILLAFCHKDSSRFRGPLLVTILDSAFVFDLLSQFYSVFKVHINLD